MQWYECSNIKELKDIGSLEKIKNEIQEDFCNKISIKSKSIDEVLELVNKIKQFKTNNTSEYFNSDLSQLIFSLTEIDGKNRQKHLKISPLHYKNKELAKKWKKTVASKLHEDRCNHPKAKDAWDKMEEMYREMLGK